MSAFENTLLSGVHFKIPSQVTIAGLAGYARSGKNFIASSYFVPRGFLPISFADHFKVDAVVRDGAPMKEVFFGDKSPATRHMLQQRGTEEGRNVYGEDIWVKTLEAWTATHVSKGWYRFVVTDVRFPNEAKWIKDMGGEVYRVHGRGGLVGGAERHVSETALDDYDGFDAHLDNTVGRSEKQLAVEVNSVIDDLLAEFHETF
jgi:hypothetical protein